MTVTASSSPKQIKLIFNAQLANRNAMPMPISERLALLNKLLSVIENHQSDIMAAGFSDCGKNPSEVMLTEIFSIFTELKHTLRHLKKWSKPKRVKTPVGMFGTCAKTVLEPKGRVLVMAPWNYPFNLTMGPLISAIAAGNQVIVKPSEMAPAMAAVIEKVIQATFVPEQVAIIQGDTAVAEELLKLPFDHVYFTGSPAIGKLVMSACAKHLTDITLELGGKSPIIVDKSANIKKAARNIAWGKFINNGQTCIAPDYMLVDEKIKGELILAIKQALVKQWHLGRDAQANPDYGRIVNQRHYQRLQSLYIDAINKGANVLCEPHFDDSDRFISPILLDNIAEDSRINEEEIFGPILLIYSYKNEQEAIERVLAKPKPLALYIYSEDKAFNQRILAKTRAGDSCINHNITHFAHPNLPFGGVNNSGIGKGHGEAGFRALSHQRSILTDKFSIIHWLYPPYTPLTKKLIALTTRYFS